MSHDHEHFFSERSDRELLEIIIIKLNTLMALTQSDFDALLNKLGPALDQLQTDLDALVAKAKSAGVDLSTEAATLQASLDKATALHTEATS